MTLQEAKHLHAFNAWADNRIFEAVAQIPADQYLIDLKTSHGGIHGTLVHLVGAQKIWLSRWLGSPDVKFLSAGDVPALSDLKAVWEKTGYETAKFLGSMTDKKLGDTITVTMSSGQTFTNTIAQTLQHLVDHSTYHRGQVVAMMRQLGIKPPATGMIGFFRETAKLK
jgi:uncharacterized damage-inducible protein DinB